MNQNRSKTQKCNNFSTGWTITKFLVKNFTTLLVEKLLHFRVLLRFWFKSYYISGFYYDSGSKVTTFLVLLHFWLFTKFLGLTDDNLFGGVRVKLDFKISRFYFWKQHKSHTCGKHRQYIFIYIYNNRSRMEKLYWETVK